MIRQIGSTYRLWVLTLMVMLLAACGSSDSEADHSAMDHPPVVAGELTVIDARANASIADSKTSAAYLTILNGLDEAVTLRSIETTIATAELHETIEKDGVLRMVPREDGFKIEAGEVLMLKPGGTHLMLTEVNAPMEAGGEVMLTLNFEGAVSLEVSAEVVGINGVDGGNQSEVNEHTHSDQHSDGHSETLTLSQEIIDAAKALNVEPLHAIDEALNEGGEIELAYVDAVDAYTAALNKIEWPAEFETMIDELNGSLDALQTALSENNLDQAKALAPQVHDVAHDLSAQIDEAEAGEHTHH